MPIVEITGAGSEMQGVGRLPEGMAVFVPGALPGETVEMGITRRADRFCEGRLLRVLSPAPQRRAPDCPVYDICGGCQGRHMTYEATLSLKRDRVRDALKRLGGMENPNVLEALGCAHPERTRNKAEFAVAGGKIGMISRDGRTLLPLTDCLLQRQRSAAALKFLSAHPELLMGLSYVVTRENRAGDVMLILAGQVGAPLEDRAVKALFSGIEGLKSLYTCRLNPRPAHALDGVCRLATGAETLSEALMGLSFRISPQSFFQVNPDQAEKLYALALEAAGLPEDKSGARVLDAYCGAGTITLAAARRARAVGVEIVAPAIRDANENARANCLSGRARFILGDAAREIPRLLRSGEKFDAAVVDPPRKGCDRALIQAMIASGIQNLAYVSCDPGTLARDLKLLTAGGYALLWARPVDMFPWTAHVETVCALTRREQ